jgi:hypothetical protein
MLIKIIKRLVLPNIDALRAKKAEELGIDLGSTAAPLAEPTAVEDDDDAVTPDDFLMGREDDDSFSDDGSGTGSSTIDPAKVKEARVSEAEIMSRISSYVSKWG